MGITCIHVIQCLFIENIAMAIYQTQLVKMFPSSFLGTFAVTSFLSWLLAKQK